MAVRQANQILKVVLDYMPEEKRVVVRGVYKQIDMDIPPKRKDSHERNIVNVFEGVDMYPPGHGFTGLVPG